ncbi:fructosamine kinase family protein [Rarobacter faecitabidus]|uniref:Fructosamine-3-kinase n=1 Tax=Rarobacter faecitabidus TaxID=13243 RepID=A0A542ZPB1_RARFA|nr:fructosamine kinase family protein [Rarobacter faecitabidus]TQL62050.1 fructosamine-3-kinase [Rarobacter faecitabidus]
MSNAFVKHASGPDDNLPGEAAGLTWLRDAQADGGAPVVDVLRVGGGELVLNRLSPGPPSPEAATRFGRALAHTHASGAPWWGCPPPEWPGPMWQGSSHSPMASRDEAPATFGEFYARYRVEPFVRRLFDEGAIDSGSRRAFDVLLGRLTAGELDHDQPALVTKNGHAVARLHGDLWTGNAFWAQREGGTEVVLIDPMAYGGHAETDLATLSVFGFDHLSEVYAGYQEASPLADGWRERLDLHRLAIVVLHAAVFGGSYVPKAARLASAYR